VQSGGAYGDGTTEAALILDPELRERLESLANSRSLPAGLLRRAKIKGIYRTARETKPYR